MALQQKMWRSGVVAGVVAAGLLLAYCTQLKQAEVPKPVLPPPQAPATVASAPASRPAPVVVAPPPAPVVPARGGLAGRGRGGPLGNNLRVQNLTYLFTDTNEQMPYSVFVSSKASPNKKNPLIVALHGYGGGPQVIMPRGALQLAEDGGYIMVAPMGYNTGGWYGLQVIGGPGGRGRGAAANPAAPGGAVGAGAPATQAARGPAAPGGRGGAGGFGGAQGGAETDAAKVRAYSEKDVLNVLTMAIKNYNVDERRIYLLGHSMGGAGALFLGEKYPATWAAVAAMAPAVFTIQPNSLQRVRDLPFILVQGDADTTVNPAGTTRWADEMKTLNMDYEYKLIPGADHGSVINAGMADVFAFFAKHVKPEKK